MTKQEIIFSLSKLYNYAFLTDSETVELDKVIEAIKKLPNNI